MCLVLIYSKAELDCLQNIYTMPETISKLFSLALFFCILLQAMETSAQCTGSGSDLPAFGNAVSESIPVEVDPQSQIATVCLIIEHPNVSSLEIELLPPNGLAPLKLMYDVLSISYTGQSGQDLGNPETTAYFCFTTGATEIAGYTGADTCIEGCHYAPANNFDNFSLLPNYNPNGNWSLNIGNSSDQSGALLSWSIGFDDSESDCAVDLCLGGALDPTNVAWTPEDLCANETAYDLSSWLAQEIADPAGGVEWQWTSIPQGLVNGSVIDLSSLAPGTSLIELTYSITNLPCPPVSLSHYVNIMALDQTGEGCEVEMPVSHMQLEQTEDHVATIEVYPNPLQNEALIINFEGKEDSEIIVLSSNGHVYFQSTLAAGPGSQQYQIDASKWSPGLYFVRLSNNTTIRTKRLLVQH